MVKLTVPMIESRGKGLDYEQILNLNLWGTELDDISVFLDMPRLQILSLSINRLAKLDGLRNCINLKELYLRKNLIDNRDELVHLQGATNLRKLSLLENPIVDTLGSNYRSTVLRMLPQVKELDGVEVCPSELQSALNHESYAMPKIEQKVVPQEEPKTSKRAAALARREEHNRELERERQKELETAIKRIGRRSSPATIRCESPSARNRCTQRAKSSFTPKERRARSPITPTERRACSPITPTERRARSPITPTERRARSPISPKERRITSPSSSERYTTPRCTIPRRSSPMDQRSYPKDLSRETYQDHGRYIGGGYNYSGEQRNYVSKPNYSLSRPRSKSALTSTSSYGRRPFPSTSPLLLPRYTQTDEYAGHLNHHRWFDSPSGFARTCRQDQLEYMQYRAAMTAASRTMSTPHYSRNTKPGPWRSNANVLSSLRCLINELDPESLLVLCQAIHDQMTEVPRTD